MIILIYLFWGMSYSFPQWLNHVTFIELLHISLYSAPSGSSRYYNIHVTYQSTGILTFYHFEWSVENFLSYRSLYLPHFKYHFWISNTSSVIFVFQSSNMIYIAHEDNYYMYPYFCSLHCFLSSWCSNIPSFIIHSCFNNFL